MQSLEDLKVYYGNCVNSTEATLFLDNAAMEDDAPICIFTECIHRSIEQAAENIHVVDSVKRHASSIKVVDNTFVMHKAFHQVPSDVVCSAIVSWSNMTIGIFSCYFTGRMTLDFFRRITNALFREALQANGVDLILIVGDFNAYHESWSTETCNNHYKRQRGIHLHQLISNSGLMVLNDLRRGFNPTWMRGTTHTVNDLFIGCSGMDTSVNSVSHALLNGSDHRLLKVEFNVQAALLHLHNKGVEIQGLTYEEGQVRVDEDCCLF